MLAVRIYGPNTVKVEQIPVEEPKAGEVVIRIKAAGLCGTDYELYTGDMAYIKRGWCRLPLTPGHEWSGVIERVGPGCNGLQAG